MRRPATAPATEAWLAAIRRRGFALRAGGTPPWPHTGSLALPIRKGRAVLGCVNAVWMARAVSAEEGVRLCLDPLRGLVAEIESGLSSLPGADGAA